MSILLNEKYCEEEGDIMREEINDDQYPSQEKKIKLTEEDEEEEVNYYFNSEYGVNNEEEKLLSEKLNVVTLSNEDESEAMMEDNPMNVNNIILEKIQSLERTLYFSTEAISCLMTKLQNIENNFMSNNQSIENNNKNYTDTKKNIIRAPSPMRDNGIITYPNQNAVVLKDRDPKTFGIVVGKNGGMLTKLKEKYHVDVYVPTQEQAKTFPHIIVAKHPYYRTHNMKDGVECVNELLKV